MKKISTALAFSGGKDSLACLLLKQDELKDIVVVWVNTGKNFPEVMETVEKYRSICPEFVELGVDRDKQNEEFGVPSSVVPILNTRYGNFAASVSLPRIQSDIECCLANIGKPLHAWCKENGITRLIRGQRNDDQLRGPMRDGEVFDGITYEHPIENWSRQDVLAFLEKNLGKLPWHMYMDHSSMDCYDCTGYPDHSKDRVAVMRDKYPAMYAEFDERRSFVLREVGRQVTFMEGL